MAMNTNRPTDHAHTLHRRALALDRVQLGSCTKSIQQPTTTDSMQTAHPSFHAGSLQRRPHSSLLHYLADYIADRSLVHTTNERAQVDRIYHRDPSRIGSWTAHWHHSTSTPYLFKRGQFLFPINATSQAITLIRSAHHVH